MLAGASLFFLLLTAGAIGWSGNGPSQGVKAADAPFGTAYGNPIKQVQYGLIPESVRLTADGGYIVLAQTRWLWPSAMAETTGVREGPAGDYALEVSAQQFSDGGYVLSGGILGCSGSYIQHALLE